MGLFWRALLAQFDARTAEPKQQFPSQDKQTHTDRDMENEIYIVDYFTQRYVYQIA